MVRLEQIVRGSRLTGIQGDGAVEVIATRAYGLDAVEVTWKGPGGLGERILYRGDEASLQEVASGGRFAFDGDGHAFRLASEALRIRLAHLFDPFVAVNASLIEPLPHQLTAVYGAMLDRQPLRFLLADDPGSGKTIMAGLLIKELLIRGSLERCLIIAPGGLVEQWQDELSDKFDLHFQIMSREQIEMSVTGNPFVEHPRLIARLDMLARNDELKAKLEAAPEWDLVVCDEAHRMSASFFGAEVKYTKRYQLGALAGRQARHFLLMTATPHNGKEEDFQLFMGLLDEDRFEGRFRQGVHKINPADMMRRLTKEELFRFDGSPLFPERRAYTVSYELSPKEANLYSEVTHYVREEMNRADRLADDGSRRRNNVGFALQILQRRLASSPAAIHESLKRRLGRLETRLEEEKLGRKGGGEAASPPPLTTSLGQELDEDDLEDATGEEIEAHEDRLLDLATAAQTIEELEAEIATLRELEKMAKALRRSGEDTKWRELDRILENPLVQDSSRAGRRKLLIFTEARDTLEYLAERIRNRTGEADSVSVIHGGVPRDRRRAVIAAFNDDPKVRFLVANDAAGEGVNLQRGAHLMVNYDLPWNPNRLEQRFGRIHRIGQTEVCHLWNLLASETREGAVYERLLTKLEIARDTLGGKVYDVLGELFAGRPLAELLMEAIRYGDQPDVRARLLQSMDGVVDTDNINALVTRNKLTREGIDPITLRTLRENMERAAARRLQPHHVRSFFEAAFSESGGVMRRREQRRFEVKRVPPLLRDRDRLMGRADPVLPRYQRICFDKEAVSVQPQAVLMAPGHPLLDALIDLTLERHGDVLTRGTVLIDEADRHSAPRVLIVLRHIIRDGRQTRHGKPQSISERLQFVWLDKSGQASQGGAAPYLDCRAPNEEEREQLADLLNASWLKEPLEEHALELAVSQLVPRHLSEVKERLLPEIAKIEAAVKERLRREITHLQHRAFEVEAEERAGKKPRLNSENIRRQANVLTGRLELRLKEIARQRDIAPLPPEICGAAVVVPAGMVSSKQTAPEDAGPVEDAPNALSRAQVEARAMQDVMECERNLGFEPRDVSDEDRGYDIESRDPGNGALRFIEVKGRRADARAITITRNEMLTALNAQKAYILAAVLVEKDMAHAPLYVTNPASLFGPEPAFNEVSRSISVSSIKAAAQENATKTGLAPK
ncbi:MAG: helicase-related protein [Gammaproteobacteria bacterium]|nr:helicase-related protein [Gammaproteobacteria bacterium]